MAKIIFGHRFDAWAEELMMLPPIIDDWQVEQITTDLVQGPYREKYRQIKIRDNGESLVSCAKYGLVSRDYYFNKLADGEMLFLPALEKKLFYSTALVRKTVAESLKTVDEILRKHGLFLVVNSGWRHPDVQELAIKWSNKILGKQETIKRFANVDKNLPRSIVPHETGGAVDLQLWSLQTNNHLTKLGDFGDILNFYTLEKQANLTEKEMHKKYVLTYATWYAPLNRRNCG